MPKHIIPERSIVVVRPFVCNAHDCTQCVQNWIHNLCYYLPVSDERPYRNQNSTTSFSSILSVGSVFSSEYLSLKPSITSQMIFVDVINLFHNNFPLWFCGLSSAAISAVGGFLFYPHNRLYRTRHSVCREDVDTEIQHCYSSLFSFAFLTVSIFYQKRCPIKRTLVMTASGHYSEIRRWLVKSDFVRWNRPIGQLRSWRQSAKW